MPGVAAGQSTGTSAKVSIDARRTASSTAVKVAVVGIGEAKGVSEIAGWAVRSGHGTWGWEGVDCREKNRSFTVLDMEHGVDGSGNGRCEGAADRDGEPVRVCGGLGARLAG